MKPIFNFKRGAHLFEVFRMETPEGVMHAGYHDDVHVFTSMDAEVVVRVMFRKHILMLPDAEVVELDTWRRERAERRA